MLLFEFNVPYHIGKGACEGKSQNADWRTCPLCGLLNTTSKPGDGYLSLFPEDPCSNFMQPSASKLYLATWQLCVFLLPASAHS